ncbi:MAG: hypothetical protein INR71_00890 [Terriglobus roseus]|nr:hypothetical protein [Terriglobus roseus]
MKSSQPAHFHNIPDGERFAVLCCLPELSRIEADPRVSQNHDESDGSTPPSVQPSPLFIPPSRARRRFAARLAQRQRAMEGLGDGEMTPDDLADATDDIDLDDVEDDEHHSIALQEEPEGLDDHHPEDTTTAWHDNERVIPVEDEDSPNPGFESPEGTEFEAGMSPVKRRSRELTFANQPAKQSSARSKGPERFSGLFASDSDSD